MLYAVVFLACLTSFSYAATSPQSISYEEGKAFAEKILKEPLVALEGLKQKQGCPNQFLKSTQLDKKAILSPVKGQTSGQLLVFVSFSMPLPALKSLAEEAEKYNARLIIRGLIDDSFPKTVAKMKDFKNGLEINPQLFEDYKVKAVPSFILIEKEREQGRLLGNVTLSYAYKKLKGEA